MLMLGQNLAKYFVLIGYLWLAVLMLTYRIALRFGYKASHTFIAIQIALSVLLTYLHGLVFLGNAKILIFIAVSTIIGALTEFAGTKTKWIFGQYRYTENFRPKLFSQVPVLVAIMWCVLAYMGFWIARLLLLPLTGQGTFHQAIFIVVASLMVVLADVVIDPMVIHKTGRNWWTWQKRGRFYGVPFSNFIGWFMTAILIYILLFALIDDLIAVPNVSPWIEYLPAFDYCLIMGAFAWACLARSLVIPGIIGLFVAASCLALGLVNIIH